MRGAPAAPTLETQRLRLRAFRHDDFDAIVAMASDPDVMRHISGPQAREEAWRRMLCGPGLWALLGYGYWIVERRDDNEVLGQVGLADFKREMDPSIEGLPELGYVFAAAAHGQGLATEACARVLTWADQFLGTAQVVAIIDQDNAPSIRVAERLGFSARESATYKGQPILLFRRQTPQADA